MSRKLTKEEINQKLEKNNRTIRIVGEYTRKYDITQFLCLICNNIYETSWANVSSGSSCLQCAIDDKRLKPNEINRRFEEKGSYIRLVGEYKNAYSQTSFLCLICNTTKEISYECVMNTKMCLDCYTKQRGLDNETFLSQIKNMPVEALESYISDNVRILFKCKCCSHEWKTTPSIIKQNKGCPKCRKTGFKQHLPAYLYYVSFEYEGRLYYKLGITKNSIRRRHEKDYKKFITILKVFYKCGKDAHEEEQRLLKEYSDYIYKGDKILSAGNTEIFTIDIFNIPSQPLFLL